MTQSVTGASNHQQTSTAAKKKKKRKGYNKAEPVEDE